MTHSGLASGGGITRAMLWATLALTLPAALVAGCRDKQPPATAPRSVAGADTVSDLRESYKKVDPSAQVGSVVISRSDLNLVAVGNVDVAAFKDGDPVTFLDSQQDVIAHGTVANRTKDLLHVRVDTTRDHRRFPEVGDLAIHVSSGVGD